MEAVLRRYLRDAGREDVTVESAGILDYTANGGPASSYIVKSAARVGVDLSAHNKRCIKQVADNAYDLYVVVDSEVAEAVLNIVGWDKIGKVFNAEVHNPWPSIHQHDYDETAKRILASMFEVMVRYFDNVE
jgi:protein-tyrosine-phosphatase